MGVVDVIFGALLLAIVIVIRYAWTHRKITPQRKRIKLDRNGERYGKSRAAERDWGKK